MGTTVDTQIWNVADGAGGETRAIFDRCAVPQGDFVYVMAHGAGGNMEHKTMTAFAQQFTGAGFDVVRFNFPYTQRGGRAPDRMPKLVDCYRSVIEHVRGQLQPKVLLMGGHSMGGRTASMLAADGGECDGLILLAYPLHPAGVPERRRDAHLPQSRSRYCASMARATPCAGQI